MTFTVEDIDRAVALARSLPSPICPTRMPCEVCGVEGPWFIVKGGEAAFVEGHEVQGCRFACADCLLAEISP